METRWSANANALITFLSAYNVIDALEDLQDDGNDKTKGGLKSILHFDFVIGLIIGKHVFRTE